jgi:hypothetical protein
MQNHLQKRSHSEEMIQSYIQAVNWKCTCLFDLIADQYFCEEQSKSVKTRIFDSTADRNLDEPQIPKMGHARNKPLISKYLCLGGCSECERALVTARALSHLKRQQW